jgi:hypothetical protein
LWSGRAINKTHSNTRSVTRVKNLRETKCIIMLISVAKTSLNLPLFIEVFFYQARKWALIYLCARGIDFAFVAMIFIFVLEVSILPLFLRFF